MKKLVFIFFALFLISTLGVAQRVKIEYDKSSLQASYAADALKKSVLTRGYILNESTPDYSIVLVVKEGLGKESYELLPEGKKITIHGGDGTGLIYGTLSLVEDFRNGVSIQNVRKRNEVPKLAFRGIKYDLPWDTYRHSYALDQHQQTCSDVNYWKAFLDMMVENRFNTLTLWNLHPYTFMIKPKNFPEASPWNDREMAQWKNLFGSIFRMAKQRGIDTYVIPFNIFVTAEFSRAHNVAMDNLDHHFFVKGDTSEIVKRYTRECVTQLLQEYPELTGMGLTLGEGMGGMTPQQREDWMKETIIEGMRQANRKSKLIHRIPFSSTTGSLGPTSIETERLTRKGIEQEAAMDFIEQPVWADLKFNWSHAHSTPKLMKVHGGKLFGAYFEPVPNDYKVIWTARNEDFFCLRWGVPEFVRQHINTNSPPYVGGYLIGSETYIPAKDYFTKLATNVDWKYAFERQWLFYKSWGRLLYNPSTPDDLFKAEFIQRYGKDAGSLFEASSLAGKTPLRLASSFDFTWDFSLYSEGFMALNRDVKRVEYISVDWQIKQPPIDPDYVSVLEYVKTISSGGSFEKGKITPPVLINMLEADCNKALSLVKNIKAVNNATLQQEVADIKVWANLGLYFAEKLKGAVALQSYRVKGGEEHKLQAIKHLENALRFWDVVVTITKPLYNEMPLVHFSEQDGKHWKENDHLRFHWELLRPEVAKDVEIAKNATVDTGN
ncbi:glycoside hydrolase family 20 zincin-like fold domain-containing protein [Chryseolinea sp. H1M3-3]|uniref:glycoside hydrolase family 20 zincin-like fold domain-containing protein n=1 Tax=Chryseolinea sp. H1M3-3 TaxID=3034144 RepID=UPI0023EB2E50|nr:glycoside hydrolase family 20 zincin-like fold domain-containing protein [Chryseolinea sp. H1M3-3]